MTFDRGDFLAAMNRLHQHYMAPEGLRRPNGLSIDGAPDFLGIAAWIFDVYLACRSGGQGTEDAWNEVVAWISQSEEWRIQHPGETPRAPRGCAATIRLDRQEFLQAMQRLDAFYRAAEGLQRENGLSIDEAPDFVGIAAWIFDVYLNGRLAGRATDIVWGEVVRNIEASEEWRAKHPDAAAVVRFAVIGDYGIAGAARSRRLAARQELECRFHRHHGRQQLHEWRGVHHRHERRPVLRGFHLPVSGELPVHVHSEQVLPDARQSRLGNSPAPRPI